MVELNGPIPIPEAQLELEEIQSELEIVQGKVERFEE
jgi:hypothetical protein